MNQSYALGEDELVASFDHNVFQQGHFEIISTVFLLFTQYQISVSTLAKLCAVQTRAIKKSPKGSERPSPRMKQVQKLARTLSSIGDCCCTEVQPGVSPFTLTSL